MHNIPTDSVLIYGEINTTIDAQVFVYDGINDDGTEVYYRQQLYSNYGKEHTLETIARPSNPPRTEWKDYVYIPN